MKKLGIYLHIPFCVRKCLYCDFCSFTEAKEELMLRYAEKLSADVEKLSSSAKDHTVDTVYLGGGTPTLLPEKAFDIIMSALYKSFSVDSSAEITAECNPATADKNKLSTMRSLGINRLSLGLQSVVDEELRALGRIHNFSDFVNTYNDARRAGFENISADLMYGIPHQTRESLEMSLRKLSSFDPQHISVYGLKIEQGTPFGKMRRELPLPDEDSEYEMYFDCGRILSEYGYNKYEISNFAHKGYESKHNIKYWECEEYLGIGVSAHSYFNGERFANSTDIEGYLSDKDITSERRYIDEKERLNEFIMLGMRLAKGVDNEEFSRRFGEDVFHKFGRELEKYKKEGFLKTEDGRIAFTDRGFMVSNYILSDILEFE